MTQIQGGTIRREPALIITIAVIFVLLALFILYPIFAVVRTSVTPGGSFSLEVYRSIFDHARYFRSIRNSVMLGIIVATLATAIGFFMAYAVDRLRIPGRPFFRAMAILLAVWAFVSYGLGVLWVEPLNRLHLGGFPLGFWFAQQGSIYVFVILVVVYAVWMDRLDRRYGVD